MSITIYLSCTVCHKTETEEIDDEGRFTFFTPTFLSDQDVCDECSA